MNSTENSLDALIPVMHAFMALVGPPSDSQSLELLNDAGLTIPQMLTLHALIANGSLAVSEVAQVIGLSRAATSQMVERMVQAKLVDRVEDERDRRHKQVSISPRGMELMRKLRDLRVANLQRLLAALSSATRERFCEVLRLVVIELGGSDRLAKATACAATFKNEPPAPRNDT